MSFESLLKDRCNIKRRSFTTRNTYGEPVYGDPSVIVSDVSCRKEEITDDLDEARPVAGNRKRYLFFYPAGTDIKSQDIIEIGSSDNYTVENVEPIGGRNATHHLEVKVEQVRDT